MKTLRKIPDTMLRNYVARYEAGGVQPRPCLRFVDARGRACIVGAFAGAGSVEEFARTGACATFLEGPLVDVSRMFEAGSVTAAEMYVECLMELARRRATAPADPAGVVVGHTSERVAWTAARVRAAARPY